MPFILAKSHPLIGLNTPRPEVERHVSRPGQAQRRSGTHEAKVAPGTIRKEIILWIPGLPLVARDDSGCLIDMNSARGRGMRRKANLKVRGLPNLFEPAADTTAETSSASAG